MYQVDTFGKISQEVTFVITVHETFKFFSNQVEYHDILYFRVVVDAEMGEYGIRKHLNLYFIRKSRAGYTLLSLSKCDRVEAESAEYEE